MDERQPKLPKLKRPSENRDPRFPNRVVILWIIVLAVIPLFVWLKQRQIQPAAPLTYGELEQKVEEGLIQSSKLKVESGAGALDRITGTYLDNNVPKQFVTQVKYSDEVMKFFKQHKIQLDFTEASQFWMTLLINAAPFILFVGLLYFVACSAATATKSPSKTWPGCRKPRKKLRRSSSSSKTRKNFSVSAAASPKAC
jgi:ATP-dependent Zn protease